MPKEKKEKEVRKNQETKPKREKGFYDPRLKVFVYPKNRNRTLWMLVLSLALGITDDYNQCAKGEITPAEQERKFHESVDYTVARIEQLFEN